MKFVDDFESFLREEVNLNKGRLETLQERVSAIEGFLEGESTFGPILLELIPAGSWAHRTIIK
ncbi:MAG: nucleotidyltransferase, partial [Chloroflexota bacterium]|nr:nucleotidyltransferase [Chloroflexota bacterium]